MNIEYYKRSLAERLREKNVEAAVGISSLEDGHDCIVVYLKNGNDLTARELVPERWHGIPVKMKRYSLGTFHGG